MEHFFLISMLFAVGGVAGLSGGLFGVGGGFIVVPALLFTFSILGYESENIVVLAISTSLATIIVTSCRAALVHSKLGSLNLDFLKSWSPWLALGTLFGVALTSVISAVALKIIFAAGVACYAAFFLFPKFFEQSTFQGLPTGSLRALIGTSVGSVSAILGIGGGTPVVITMTLCGRPITEAAGTAAGVGCVIGFLGSIFFVILGLLQPFEGMPPGTLGPVNIMAFLIISVASLFTAPLGARLVHKLNPNIVKKIFGCYLVGIATVIFIQNT